MTRHVAYFDGTPIHTVVLADRRPCWSAREIGAALGYSEEGKRLPDRIRGEWHGCFIEQKDFAILVDDEAVAFCAVSGAMIDPRIGGVVVLYESGLHIALDRTTMPAGRTLRQFIVEEALPQALAAEVVAPQPAPVSAPVDRETRLIAQHELHRREFECNTLRDAVRVLHRSGRLDDDSRAALEVRVAEIALGRDLPELRPSGPDGWRSVREVAAHARVASVAVVRAARRIGLTGNVIGLVRGADHESTWRFSPEAVERLMTELRNVGQLRATG